MTAQSMIQTAYILSGLLFILALAGLSRHESAKLGNWFGMTGMTLAGAATFFYAIDHSERGALATTALLVVPLLIGSAIGLWLANKVEMTGMPQLIAMLHSFVGVAAVAVGIASYLDTEHNSVAHLIEVAVGVLIGAYTFTGSVVAFGKLSGKMSSRPLMLPHRNLINLAMLLAAIGATVWFTLDPTIWALLIITALGLALGYHMVASIGGGDMPVVVSMLNSYSGWAAAAAGFMLGNNLLIVTGALVGSSGAIDRKSVV